MFDTDSLSGFGGLFDLNGDGELDSVEKAILSEKIWRSRHTAPSTKKNTSVNTKNTKGLNTK